MEIISHQRKYSREKKNCLLECSEANHSQTFDIPVQISTDIVPLPILNTEKSKNFLSESETGHGNAYITYSEGNPWDEMGKTANGQDLISVSRHAPILILLILFSPFHHCTLHLKDMSNLNDIKT